MNKFSKRLRQLRVIKEMKQSEISEILGVSMQSYSAYENGREPNYDTLIQIATFFDVSTDYLLGKSGSKISENIDITEKLGLSDDAIFMLEQYVRDTKKNSEFKKYEKVGVSPIKLVNSILEYGKFWLFIESFCESVYDSATFYDEIVKNNLLPRSDPNYESKIKELHALAPKGFAVVSLSLMSSYKLLLAKGWLEGVVLNLQRIYLDKYLKSEKAQKKKENDDNGNH